MATFENPQNGHREEVGFWGPTFGTFFLGPIYLMAVGLIGQGLGLLVLLIALAMALNIFVIFVAPVVCLLWGFQASNALERKWLEKGWQRVE